MDVLTRDMVVWYAHGMKTIPPKLDHWLTVRGVAVPPIVYGTAWKEEATARLVGQALAAGFRGIDTANQRRHYHEAGVGEALSAWISAGRLTRADLFLQTKFTFQPGQDHRLPYDPAAPIGEQVRQSFACSLEHLGITELDSYVLHGPSVEEGLGPDDREAWQAMEALHESGQTRLLGVSNVTLDQLAALCEFARVRPAFVQNRCYAVTGWDHGVRAFCRAHEIVYQGFSLLTANRQELARPHVAALAARYGVTVPQLVFRFAQQIGILPLTGTTDPGHMRADLACAAVTLAQDDLAFLENIGDSHGG
jgi:diketogulonate reductase-like aldo/keto reductase